MASAWGSSWGGSWGGSWGPITVDPNAMVGSATFGFTTTGTLTAAVVPVPPVVVASPATGGAGGLSRHYRPQSAPKEFHDAVKQGRIRQDDEDLTVLVAAFLRIMT